VWNIHGCAFLETVRPLASAKEAAREGAARILFASLRDDECQPT
jgi:hypothetical protein